MRLITINRCPSLAQITTLENFYVMKSAKIFLSHYEIVAGRNDQGN